MLDEDEGLHCGRDGRSLYSWEFTLSVENTTVVTKVVELF